MSAFDASPVFQTLISEDVVEPIFSFKLNTSDSELYLGGVNYNLFTGDFTWVALTDEVCCPVNYHLGVNLDPNLLVRVTGKHPSIVSPWTERPWWEKP